MEIILNIDPDFSSSVKLDIPTDTEYEAWRLRSLARQLNKTADFMEELDGHSAPVSVPTETKIKPTDAEQPKANPFKIDRGEDAEAVKVNAKADMKRAATPKAEPPKAKPPKPKPLKAVEPIAEQGLAARLKSESAKVTAPPKAAAQPQPAKPKGPSAPRKLAPVPSEPVDPEAMGEPCEPLQGYSAVPRQDNGMPDFQFAHDDLLTNGIARGRSYGDIARDLGHSVSIGELMRRYARLNAHKRDAS